MHATNYIRHTAKTIRSKLTVYKPALLNVINKYVINELLFYEMLQMLETKISTNKLKNSYCLDTLLIIIRLKNGNEV